MILKPKSTVRNPKALVYRRFTQLQDSYSTNTIYKTEDDKFWAFNGNNSAFLEVDSFSGQVVEVETRGTILEYKGHQFIYTGEWENAITSNQTIVQLEEQPTFYEPQSDTYWAIVQASNGDVSTKQVSTPTQNVITMSLYPTMYETVGDYVATFLGDTFRISNTIRRSTIPTTMSFQTSDNKYWKYQDGLMVEILSPLLTNNVVANYDIVINGENFLSNTPRDLMYYDGTQWNYGLSNVYTVISGGGSISYYGVDKETMLNNAIYYVADNGEHYFFYDNTKQVGNQMIEIPSGYSMVGNINPIAIDPNYIYVGKRHTYSYENGSFNMVDGIILPNSEFLSAKFGNIARYQTNKYYFVGSFDYMIRGSIEGTTTQHIKGNIMPLTSLNIKYFNDDIELNVDDLVVIEDHLFSVENPETTQKRMPKAFKVHFATLNSIL